MAPDIPRSPGPDQSSGRRRAFDAAQLVRRFPRQHRRPDRARRVSTDRRNPAGVARRRPVPARFPGWRERNDVAVVGGGGEPPSAVGVPAPTDDSGPAGCPACDVVGPLLTAPGTSGRCWACACGRTWHGAACDHRAPAASQRVAVPPAPPAPGAALVEVPLRGSGGASAGSSGGGGGSARTRALAASAGPRPDPLPAELVALPGDPGSPGPGQRHLSVAADESEREPEPGEVCSCGRPAIVVFLTERFGAVASCQR